MADLNRTLAVDPNEAGKPKEAPQAELAQPAQPAPKAQAAPAAPAAPSAPAPVRAPIPDTAMAHQPVMDPATRSLARSGYLQQALDDRIGQYREIWQWNVFTQPYDPSRNLERYLRVRVQGKYEMPEAGVHFTPNWFERVLGYEEGEYKPYTTIAGKPVTTTSLPDMHPSVPKELKFGRFESVETYIPVYAGQSDEDALQEQIKRNLDAFSSIGSKNKLAALGFAEGATLGAANLVPGFNEAKVESASRMEPWEVLGSMSSGQMISVVPQYKYFSLIQNGATRVLGEVGKRTAASAASRTMREAIGRSPLASAAVGKVRKGLIDRVGAQLVDKTFSPFRWVSRNIGNRAASKVPPAALNQFESAVREAARQGVQVIDDGNILRVAIPPGASKEVLSKLVASAQQVKNAIGAEADKIVFRFVRPAAGPIGGGVAAGTLEGIRTTTELLRPDLSEEDKAAVLRGAPRDIGVHAALGAGLGLIPSLQGKVRDPNTFTVRPSSGRAYGQQTQISRPRNLLGPAKDVPGAGHYRSVVVPPVAPGSQGKTMTLTRGIQKGIRNSTDLTRSATISQTVAGLNASQFHLRAMQMQSPDPEAALQMEGVARQQTETMLHRLEALKDMGQLDLKPASSVMGVDTEATLFRPGLDQATLQTEPEFFKLMRWAEPVGRIAQEHGILADIVNELPVPAGPTDIPGLKARITAAAEAVLAKVPSAEVGLPPFITLDGPVQSGLMDAPPATVLPAVGLGLDIDDKYELSSVPTTADFEDNPEKAIARQTLTLDRAVSSFPSVYLGSIDPLKPTALGDYDPLPTQLATGPRGAVDVFLEEGRLIAMVPDPQNMRASRPVDISRGVEAANLPEEGNWTTNVSPTSPFSWEVKDGRVIVQPGNDTPQMRGQRDRFAHKMKEAAGGLTQDNLEDPGGLFRMAIATDYENEVPYNTILNQAKALRTRLKPPTVEEAVKYLPKELAFDQGGVSALGLERWNEMLQDYFMQLALLEGSRGAALRGKARLRQEALAASGAPTMDSPVEGDELDPYDPYPEFMDGTTNPFYSRVYDSVKANPQGSWQEDQLIKWLLSKGGIKPLEISLLRLSNAFIGKKKLKKKDLLSWLQENSVQVQVQIYGPFHKVKPFSWGRIAPNMWAAITTREGTVVIVKDETGYHPYQTETDESALKVLTHLKGMVPEFSIGNPTSPELYRTQTFSSLAEAKEKSERALQRYFPGTRHSSWTAPMDEGRDYEELSLRSESPAARLAFVEFIKEAHKNKRKISGFMPKETREVRLKNRSKDYHKLLVSPAHFPGNSAFSHARMGFFETSDGASVALSHEVQSDLGEKVRKYNKESPREDLSGPAELVAEWLPITLKAQLRRAVERGADYFAWTTPEQQAIRNQALTSQTIEGTWEYNSPFDVVGEVSWRAFEGNHEIGSGVLNTVKPPNVLTPTEEAVLKQVKESDTGQYGKPVLEERPPGLFSTRIWELTYPDLARLSEELGKIDEEEIPPAPFQARIEETTRWMETDTSKDTTEVRWEGDKVDSYLLQQHHFANGKTDIPPPPVYAVSASNRKSPTNTQIVTVLYDNLEEALDSVERTAQTLGLGIGKFSYQSDPQAPQWLKTIYGTMIPKTIKKLSKQNKWGVPIENIVIQGMSNEVNMDAVREYLEEQARDHYSVITDTRYDMVPIPDEDLEYEDYDEDGDPIGEPIETETEEEVTFYRVVYNGESYDDTEYEEEYEADDARDEAMQDYVENAISNTEYDEEAFRSQESEEDYTVPAIRITQEMKDQILGKGFPILSSLTNKAKKILDDLLDKGWQTEERASRVQSGVHILGSAAPVINTDGGITLRGQVANSVEEVARLGQVLRDPALEHFHWLYIGASSGKIYGHHSLTARLPDTTAMVELTPTQRKRLREVAGTPQENAVLTSVSLESIARLSEDIYSRVSRIEEKADEEILVYGLHNHPTGSPEVSDQDVISTKLMDQALSSRGIRWSGNIVIDHEKFSTIAPDGSVKANLTHNTTPPGGPKSEDPFKDPELPHWTLGVEALGASRVAQIGKHILTDSQSFVSALYRDAQGLVVGSELIPLSYFNNAPGLIEWIRGRNRTYGASSVMFYHPDPPLNAVSSAITAMAEGSVRDLVSDDGGLLQSDSLLTPEGAADLKKGNPSRRAQGLLRSLQVNQPERRKDLRDSETYQEALHYVNQGGSFSERPDLFEALSDEEKHYAMLARITGGYVSGWNHLNRLDPSAWETTSRKAKPAYVPRYFGSWRPNPVQMEDLKGAFAARKAVFQQEVDSLRELERISEKPTEKRTPLTHKELAAIQVETLDRIALQRPHLFREFARQFWRDFDPDSTPESAEAELKFNMMEDLLTSHFEQGSGIGFEDLPQNAKRAKKALQHQAMHKSIEARMQQWWRPFSAIGPRSQIMHPKEWKQALETGQLDNNVFIVIDKGYRGAQEAESADLEEFEMLERVIERNRKLNRKTGHWEGLGQTISEMMFRGVDQGLPKEVLSKYTWEVPMAPGRKMTVRLDEWVPKFRRWTERKIEEATDSIVAGGWERVAAIRLEQAGINEEISSRIAREANNWLGINVKHPDEISEACKALGPSCPAGVIGDASHGVIRSRLRRADKGTGKPNKANRYAAFPFPRLEKMVKDKEEAKTTLLTEMDELRKGKLKQDNYIYYLHQLVVDDASKLFETGADPYMSWLARRRPETKNAFLKKRGVESTPIEDWAFGWRIYTHMMNRTIHLEPALRQALNLIQDPEYPAAQQHYTYELVGRLKGDQRGEEKAIDDILRRDLLKDPTLRKKLLKLFRGEDVNKAMEEYGDLIVPRTPGKEARRAIIPATYGFYLNAMKVSALNLVETAFIIPELAHHLPDLILPWRGPWWVGSGFARAGGSLGAEAISNTAHRVFATPRFWKNRARANHNLDFLHEAVSPSRSMVMQSSEGALENLNAKATNFYLTMFGVNATEQFLRAFVFDVLRRRGLTHGLKEEDASYEASLLTHHVVGSFNKMGQSPKMETDLGRFALMLQRYSLSKLGELGSHTRAISEAFGLKAKPGGGGKIPPPPGGGHASRELLPEGNDPEESAAIARIRARPSQFGMRYATGGKTLFRSLNWLMGLMLMFNMQLPAAKILLETLGHRYKNFWDYFDPYYLKEFGSVAASLVSDVFTVGHSFLGERTGMPVDPRAEMAADKARKRLMYFGAGVSIPGMAPVMGMAARGNRGSRKDGFSEGGF